MKSRPVDILFVIGPDNPGEAHMGRFTASVENACIKAQLSYRIADSGLDILPKAKHVFVLGHGSVRVTHDDKMRHSVKLEEGKPSVPSVNALQHIQKTTKSEKMVFVSCYGGRVNEDIKNAGGIGAGVELITVSSANDATSSIFSLPAAKMYIQAIQNSQKTVNMGQVFDQFTRAMPETITYGVHNKGYQTHTSRRQDHPLGNENSLDKWMQLRNDNLNDFLKSNKKPIIPHKPLTLGENVKFRQDMAVDAMWRGDMLKAEQMMRANPDIIKADSLGETLLYSYPQLVRHTKPGNAVDVLEFAARNAPDAFMQLYSDDKSDFTEDDFKKLTQGLLRVAENCDQQLSDKIMAAISIKYTPSELLREADNLGLKRFANDLITMHPIDDDDLKEVIKHDEYALAFASKETRNNPEIVRMAMNGKLAFLKYVGDDALAALVQRNVLSQEEIARVQYRVLNNEFKHNLSVMNRNGLDPEIYKVTSKEISHQAQGLQKLKDSFPPHVVASINFLEATEKKEALAATLTKHTYSAPELRPRLEAGYKSLIDAENQARSQLGEIYEKLIKGGEAARRQEEGVAYKRYQAATDKQQSAKTSIAKEQGENVNNNDNDNNTARPRRR